ncbi:unnamed protein product [Pneumocystis jirovecii]|uniref:Uncharacterized protein n=1 Tax=Pneumocystis jirovecii TaxID=42068 RepID=L0PGL5_PNEJI|nr:unnamed protein product [Pneumocystis jirovecii]
MTVFLKIVSKKKIVYPNQTKNIGHKESKDIVIAGFGWINVRTTHGCKDIKIFSPKIEGILLLPNHQNIPPSTPISNSFPKRYSQLLGLCKFSERLSSLQALAANLAICLASSVLSPSITYITSAVIGIFWHKAYSSNGTRAPDDGNFGNVFSDADINLRVEKYSDNSETV